MYHGFLDNNMPSDIVAEYFRKSTVQCLSICASIRVVGDVTSFGLAKGFQAAVAAAFPPLYTC